MLKNCASAFLCCAAIVGAAAAAHAGSYQSLYDFTAWQDGRSPQSSLIDVNGVLYGTTFYGGENDLGTVFSFDPASGTETVLHQFNPDTDGSRLASGVVEYGGLLYGAATEGGVRRHGTAFSVNPTTNAFAVLYSFGGKANGDAPGSLVQAGSKLYGTTSKGPGKSGYGTVFSLNPATGVTKTLHAFNGTDGADPSYGLVLVHGMLFGTTASGGNGFGTVFSVNPKTGVESTLYAFKGVPDGASPNGGLIDVGGTLYGTTYAGGPADAGTIFSIDPASDVETAIYSFPTQGPGIGPSAGLVDVSGKLYGTTRYGGKKGYGTIFSFDLAQGTEKDVYSFRGVGDGQHPVAAMVDVGGTLYGTTSEGGFIGGGTVFSYTP